MLIKLDHFTITTSNIKKCVDFYEKVGFEVAENAGKYELRTKSFKIELNIMGRQIPPHARSPQPGSYEICFEVDMPIKVFVEKLAQKQLTPENQPAAKGSANSAIYRDPDGNLIEFVYYGRRLSG